MTNLTMNQSPRNSPRAEYLARERQRIEASPSLADKYKNVTALTVEFGNCDSEGVGRCSQIKYTVNLTGAKSIFCFSCQNPDCVGGDFDLTNALARAIAEHRTEVTGEIRCLGWRSRHTMGSIRCDNLLRFRFVLQY